MCFRKKNQAQVVNIPSKYHVGDFVDFWHRDDLYFGLISDVKINDKNEVIYDIEIAGQCPTTFTNISESIVVRIHK